jgi:hypothetical protein
MLTELPLLNFAFNSILYNRNIYIVVQYNTTWECRESENPETLRLDGLKLDGSKAGWLRFQNLFDSR